MCGLPGALSLMVIVPLRAPVAGGVNVTLIVQLAPGATLGLQLLVCAKSPLAAMLVTVNKPVPVFDSVTVCAELVVPTSQLPKAKLMGDRLIRGPADATCQSSAVLSATRSWL